MNVYEYRYWLPTGKWSEWESCSHADYCVAKTFVGWQARVKTWPKEQRPESVASGESA